MFIPYLPSSLSIIFFAKTMDKIVERITVIKLIIIKLLLCKFIFKYNSSTFVISKNRVILSLYNFSFAIFIVFSMLFNVILFLINLLSSKFISKYGINFKNFNISFISPSFFLLSFISKLIICNCAVVAASNTIKLPNIINTIKKILAYFHLY